VIARLYLDGVTGVAPALRWSIGDQ